LAESKSLFSPFLDHAQQEPTRHPRLLRYLEEGGASFLTRLSREMEKPPSELLPDLLDLAWEGRVSNDQFAPLRLQVNAKQANWARAGSGLGRWYATCSLRDESDPARDVTVTSERDSPVLVWTHHLLQSYGVINRELVANIAPFSWDVFYPVLKRLEEWGVLTRGTFIQGLTNLQFTTRELSDSMRQSLPLSSEPAYTILSSADPANPFGLLMDWPEGARGASFARKPGNFLLLKGDKWLLWIENNGKRVFTLPEANKEPFTSEEEAEIVQSAFQTIIRRRKLVKIKVDSWNGEAIQETETGKTLLRLGAERDQRSLVIWSK
jgi:ATP-dependent Lhr-like helicase